MTPRQRTRNRQRFLRRQRAIDQRRGQDRMTWGHFTPAEARARNGKNNRNDREWRRCAEWIVSVPGLLEMLREPGMGESSELR
jgi:hypothetical protein